MGFSVWQILIVALVVLVLFGRGRISEMMGDFGKGIKSFKKGLAEEEDTPANGRIEAPATDAKPVGEAAKDVQPADKSAP